MAFWGKAWLLLLKNRQLLLMILIMTRALMTSYLHYSSDSNGNDDLNHLSPAADLIDEIGPAPDFKLYTSNIVDEIGPAPDYNPKKFTKMVAENPPDFYGELLSGSEAIPDTYSSLQRPSGRRQSRREAYQRTAAEPEFLYGTYRPHNNRRPRQFGLGTFEDDDFELYARSHKVDYFADFRLNIHFKGISQLLRYFFTLCNLQMTF